MNNTVAVGSTWQHYKGNQYEIVALGKIEANEEDAVVYRALYGDHQVWIRPLAAFLEEVEWEGKKVSRFQKVS